MKTSLTKNLPDLSKSFNLFKLAEEVDFLAGQQSEHNMLALAIYNAFQNKTPIRDVLGFVVSCYKDNPKALLTMFSSSLICKIQNAIHEE